MINKFKSDEEILQDEVFQHLLKLNFGEKSARELMSAHQDVIDVNGMEGFTAESIAQVLQDCWEQGL